MFLLNRRQNLTKRPRTPVYITTVCKHGHQNISRLAKALRRTDELLESAWLMYWYEWLIWTGIRHQSKGPTKIMNRLDMCISGVNPFFALKLVCVTITKLKIYLIRNLLFFNVSFPFKTIIKNKTGKKIVLHLSFKLERHLRSSLAKRTKSVYKLDSICKIIPKYYWWLKDERNNDKNICRLPLTTKFSRL